MEGGEIGQHAFGHNYQILRRQSEFKSFVRKLCLKILYLLNTKIQNVHYKLLEKNKK